MHVAAQADQAAFMVVLAQTLDVSAFEGSLTAVHGQVERDAFALGGIHGGGKRSDLPDGVGPGRQQEGLRRLDAASPCPVVRAVQRQPQAHEAAAPARRQSPSQST